MTLLTKERRRTVGWMFVGLCAGVVMALVITWVASTSKSSSKTADLAQAIRDTQKTNTAVNSTNTQLLEIIHSCLTPGQPCFQEAQRQRAMTAASNKRVVIAAVTCAATIPNPTVPTVGACVQAFLASDSAR